MASSLVPTGSALVKGAETAAKSAVIYTARGGSGGGGNFQPRQTFEASESTTRSYYLGHHHAALTRMRQMLSHVGLVIECRDFRVPLTSYNPLLEQLLTAAPLSSSSGGPERARIIAYTKRDLGPPAGGDVDRMAQALAEFHARRDRAAAVVFLGSARGEQHHNYPGARGDRDLLGAVKRVAREHDSLTGLRAMVVGMPNVGKSTLLNRLRARGMGLPKAARTGAQPGITRKLGTPVRIAAGEDDGSDSSAGLGEGVFVVDTPGVFVPYVRDAEAMLKLALVGCVKDALVPLVSVADYLLYRMNLAAAAAAAAAGGGPELPLYATRFCGGRPTNDVHEFLAAVAYRTGKLVRGGAPSLDAAAAWVVHEWRRGALGRFVLDDVTPVALARMVDAARTPPLSMNQARKREKVMRKERGEAKRLGRLSLE